MRLPANCKINSQQEKPVIPNRKNLFPQNTQNRPSTKLNSPKNLVPPEEENDHVKNSLTQLSSQGNWTLAWGTHGLLPSPATWHGRHIVSYLALHLAWGTYNRLPSPPT